MSRKRNLWYKKHLIGLSACMMFGFSGNAATSGSASKDCDSLSAVFMSSDNSQQKIKVIRELAAKKLDCQSVLTQVIFSGLNDERLSVVEEAILWVGNKKISAAAPAILDLYRKVSQKHPGSQPRLESKIIVALGSIDGKETRELFAQLLSRGNIDSNMEVLLSSISASCSHDVLVELKSFSHKMSETLSTMSNTPENSYRYALCKRMLVAAETLIKNDASR